MTPISVRSPRPLRRALAACCLLLLAACGDSTSTSGADTLTEIDYYNADPQNTVLPGILQDCGKQAGVTIQRQTVPQGQLMSKLLLQASSRAMPDLALVDNPNLQQLAATGALVPLSEAGLSTAGLYPSIVAAGQYQGKTYGIAPGVNGLALFYNTDLFTKAELTPPKTWDELSAAAKKLTQGSQYGLAFSAAATEEGAWQFEPFLWTGGADLRQLDSPPAVAALSLLQNMVVAGSVSKSVVTWTQSDVNDQFMAGNAAMMVNGPWQLPTLNANKALHFAVVPIPSPSPAAKPITPLGGEVWTVARSNPAREAKAAAVVKCLLSPEKSAQWSKEVGYVPSDQAAAAQLAASDPQLAAFVQEIATAKARTAELGTAYPKVSQALVGAIQAALAGDTSPQDALSQAQRAAQN